MPGRHVHTHNVLFEELSFDYEYPSTERALPQAPADVPTFAGYPREDGRVGTRNYIAVVAASNCAAHTAELIAESFAGERLPRQRGRRGRVSARRRMRAQCRGRSGATAADARGGVDASERGGRDHSGAGLRDQSDRSLPGQRGRAHGSAGGHDAAIERRYAGDGGCGAGRNRQDDRAGGERAARGDSGIENRAGFELRRLGFVFGHHGESGAGGLLRHAGRDRRDGGAGRDDRDLRRGASPRAARAQSRGGGAAAWFRARLQGLSAPIRRQLRRQSLARQ